MPTYADGVLYSLCNGPRCHAVYHKAARSGPDDPMYHFCSNSCLRAFSIQHPRSVYAQPVDLPPLKGRSNPFEGAQCNPLLDYLFFPETYLPDEHAQAKKLCATCPAFDACNEYAMTHNVHGTWAGKTREDRLREQGRPSHPERLKASA